MISSSVAHCLIEETLTRVFPNRESVTVSLDEAAGRVLTEAVFADRDQPPFHRVAMDGVAIAYRANGADEFFQVRGRLSPGRPNPEGNPPEGDPIEVMTGAALPSGWDTVIPWELLESKEACFRVSPGEKITLGMNVHHRGSDYRSQELLIPQGTRVTIPHLHILASVGCDNVQVFAQPRITLIATGDELVPVSSVPQPHQIRLSNMVVLAAALKKAGIGIQSSQQIPDDPRTLQVGIARALAESDVLLLSGAVSMGSKDAVPQVLESLGCTCVFHRIAQKPGKPMWFGISPQGGVVFALPGNPVASLVCFRRYILDRLCHWGAQDPLTPIALPLGEVLLPDPSKTQFIPVLLAVDDTGKTVLVPRRGGGSGNFFALVPSHGFIELPEGNQVWSKGTQVSFYPWEVT